MKKKIIIIFSILLVIILGYFMWQKFNSKGDNSFINRNIPKGFMYTNFTGDRMPDSLVINDTKKIKDFNINNIFSGDTTCTTTGKEAEIITFYEIKPDCTKKGVGCGNITRKAIVCGNQYLIFEALTAGWSYYGPFEIKQ